jgi:predicted O-methyltransferase YrrM
MLNKIRLLLKNPEFLTQYRSRKIRLTKILEIEENDIEKYFDESAKFWKIIQDKLDERGAIERMSFERLQLLYSVVRAIKPKVMIETGVAGGSTSFLTLSAMEKNGIGKLFSIDIDNPIWHDHSGFKVGWLVPDELRKNWKLIIGDSKKELPFLLESLKEIDIFFHDSDHSYEHMTFEFKTVYPFLSSTKTILADDINLNNSLNDFSKENKMWFEKFYGFGIARNLKKNERHIH